MQGSSLERGKNKIKGQIPRIYNNGSLKLISVIFAILLWFFVTNYQDPETVLTLNNVPVKILHTEALKAEGKVYIVLDDSDTIPVVTINAPRSVVDALEADNVVATADLYNLTPDNTVPIVLTTNKYSDAITHISGSINQVSLSIEDEKTGTLTITPAVSGSVADGYEIGQITMDQNQVRVTGPASEVNNVASAGVTVDMSDTENSINTYAEIHLYDRDGIDIDIDKNLKLNIDKVMVRVEVLTVKEIPVKIAVSGTPAEGYRLTGETSVEPGRIKIAGKKSTLETVDSVSIPSSELSVAGMRKDFVKNVDITKYLPEDVALASGQSSSIKVTIEITEKETEEE
jgi:YbbR domain-containing protein